MTSTVHDAVWDETRVRWVREADGELRLVCASGLCIATIMPGRLPCCGRDVGGYVWSLSWFVFDGRHGHVDSQEDARVAVVTALFEVKATSAQRASTARLP